MATFDGTVFKKEYKEEDDKNKTRTAGLELEVKITNPESELYQTEREDYIYSFEDYDIDSDNDYIQALKYLLEENKLPFAGAGPDGDDIELVTHPDSITLFKEGGSKRFKEAMRYLKKNAVGGKQAERSGTHVNIGILETDEVEVIMDNAYWICMNFAIPLQKIAGRISHWAQFNQYPNTAKHSRTEIKNTIDKNEYHDLYVQTEQKSLSISRAANTNIKHQCLVRKYKTYEFRIFKSTVDKNEAIAWVELCHNIIQIASGLKPINEVTLEDLLEGAYINKYAHNLKGNRKLTELELKQPIKNIVQLQSYSSNNTIIL